MVCSSEQSSPTQNQNKMTNTKSYLNYHGYSDIKPFEVLSVTASGKTAIIRQMKAERDLTWFPEIISGGFAGHCTNQNEQRWNISSDEDGFVTKARLSKSGHWKSSYGKHYMSDKPISFYDYNF